MISIEKKFLFIHVPKTGGNSVQNILSAYSEDEIVTPAAHQDGVERFEVRSKQYDTVKHSTYAHYKQLLTPDLFKTLYKFSTIRNPWDMMISFYFSPHRGVKQWDREAFKKLIPQVAPLRNYIAHRSLADKVNQKAGLRLVPSKPRPLDADIDFIMRFEHLDSDFKTVCERLDIPYTPLPTRNRSSREHYSTYYDQELKALVQARFHEEIAFGGYRFERSAEK